MARADVIRQASRPAGSWLAIFAMLMVLLGPLIGQGSTMMHQTGATDDYCMAVPDAEHGHPAAHLDHLLDACGYCSLFAHTPGIPQAHCGLSLRTAHATPHTEFSLRLALRDVPVFPGAMGHAPPVRSLL